MNKMNKILEDYWELLNISEDYLKTGYRQEHEAFEMAEDTMQKISIEISACTNCRLCEGRNLPVPGAGAVNPLVLIIGEGPGAEEDSSGFPFVGRAGKYMDKWMDAIGLSREKDLFITNIVKCRPPGNRDPLPDEMKACMPFLERQIRLLKPRLILSLGRIAAQTLTGSTDGIGRLRERTYEYQGIPLIPTYHPSGVLRNQDEYRKPVWDDLRRVRAFLDELKSE